MLLREVVVGRVSKFRTEEGGNEEANAEPDVCEAANAGGEAVGGVEEVGEGSKHEEVDAIHAEEEGGVSVKNRSRGL